MMVHIHMSRSYIKVHGHRMQLFFFRRGCTLWRDLFGYLFSAEVL